MKRFVVALALALLLLPSVASAQEHDDEANVKPSSSSAKAAVHAPSTPDAVTHHTVTIGGRTIAYTARAGTITLQDEKEQPALRVFYTAYTVDDGGRGNRPITFLYNGGPGSSTLWLRMGSVGPVRVATSDGSATGPAPYRLVSNESSILDKSDLVFIDMPTSGFGRLLGNAKPKDFYGVDQDVQAFGQFVERYITTFSRWNSPKFLFGESYGTTRSAALVDYLQERGIAINGVVLLSSILNFALDWSDTPIGGGDWAYVLYLPTEAATAWYHHKASHAPADLPAFLSQVERFAGGEYLDALSKGAALDARERDDVVQKLHEYLGLSRDYIVDSDLRIPYDRFEKQLLRGQGGVVGRLDSRFETFDLDRAGSSTDWDPAEVAISSAFVATANEYLRTDLRYSTPLLYRANVYDLIEKSGGWSWKHHDNDVTNVAPDLARAMTTNPHLRVFAANGYYDFATPYFATVYTLRHLNLAPQLQKNISYGFYEAGHMVYINPASLRSFKADLDRWYEQTLSAR